MRNKKRSKHQVAACRRVCESMTEHSIVLAMKHEMFFYKGVNGVLSLLDNLRSIKAEGFQDYLVTDTDPIFFGAILENPWKLLSDDFVSKRLTTSYKHNLSYVKDSFALLFACGWPEKGMPAKWAAIANDHATCRGILRTIQSKGAPWHNKTARKIIGSEYSHKLWAYIDALDVCAMDISYPRSKWFARYVEFCSKYELIAKDRLRHLERHARGVIRHRDELQK